MASETVGSQLAQTGMDEDEYTSNIALDIVKGWNDRRLSNNVNISSLVPFVQLIGVFNPTEYEKMFGGDGDLSKKPVYFAPSPGENEEVLATDYMQEHNIGDPQEEQPKGNQWQWIQDKLMKRFIDLFIFEGSIVGEGEEKRSILTMAPLEGIMMAQYKSQAAGAIMRGSPDEQALEFDSTGGIGITDLQVDYGKTNALGSRKLNIRMTVNDPKILDEYPEYSKLSTMNGEFIILYGWSNPQIIEGFDATPPPVLMKSTAHLDRQMMIVALDNIDTGGYWSAVKVNVTSYDFSFNEMGHLEINVGFMDKTSMMMNSVRVASVAPTWKKIMGTGDYDPANTSNSPTEDFTEVMVTLEDGTKVPVAQLIDNEQNAGSTPEGSNTTGAAPPTTEDLNKRLAVPFLDSLEEVAEAGSVTTYAQNKGQFNQESYWDQVKKRERLGFPYGGPGIRSYEKIKIRRPIDPADADADADDVDDEGNITDADGNITQGTEEVTAYRVKIVYYYLGWILEAMRLSLNSQNRSRVREGDKSFNPKFKYLRNESTSKLKSAFQSKVSQTERGSTINERIQNAIIRLKENCMPPFRSRWIDASYRDITQPDGTIKRTPYWPEWKPLGGVDALSDGRPQNVKNEICAGRVVVEGNSSGGREVFKRSKDARDAEKIANKIFPMPEGMDTIFPMRGHRVRIDPSDAQYANILDESEKTHDPFFVFKPDWFIQDVIETDDPLLSNPEVQIKLPDAERDRLEGAERRKIKVIPAGGSPDGFDPLNPTAYKAADRGGRFFYKVEWVKWGIGTYAGWFSVFVMEVDAFRQSDGEIWQLTQRKWYNLYVQYLGNYFEKLIRDRIAELEKEGKTVEDIYNEPLDLDFLTSKVFYNWRCSAGSKLKKPPPRWTPCTWDQVERFFPIEEELEDSIKKAEAEKRKLEENLEDERVAEEFVLEESVTLQENTNALKEQIEELSGGRYEISINAAGDEIYTNFKNWKQIVPGQFEPATDQNKRVTEWESEFGIPQAKLEWMIWKNFEIPTDNFSNAPVAREPERLQSKWKDENVDQIEALQTLVEENQTIISKNLSSIYQKERVLKKNNDKYLDTLQNINALETQIGNLELRLVRYADQISGGRGALIRRDEQRAGAIPNPGGHVVQDVDEDVIPASEGGEIK